MKANPVTNGIGIHGDDADPNNFQLFLGPGPNGEDVIATEPILNLSQRMPTLAEDRRLTPIIGTMLVHAMHKLPQIADMDVHPHFLDITVTNKEDMRVTIRQAVHFARRAMDARPPIGYVYLFEADRTSLDWLGPLVDELFGPDGTR